MIHIYIYRFYTLYDIVYKTNKTNLKICFLKGQTLGEGLAEGKTEGSPKAWIYRQFSLVSLRFSAASQLFY